MSQWTHVNAHIRIDGIPDMHEGFNWGNKAVVPISTDDHDWDKFEEEYQLCDIPCGSEGSLDYRIDIVGGGFVYANVAIWGDLRDYEDEQEILDWIYKNTKNEMIRSAVIEIHVEFSGKSYYTIEYNTELEKNEIKKIFFIETK